MMARKDTAKVESSYLKRRIIFRGLGPQIQ